MAIENENIAFYRGEDVDLTFTMTPLEDITGWSIIFTVRKELGFLPILFQKSTTDGSVVILDGPEGVFRVHVKSIDTAGADVGDYFWDTQREDPDHFTELAIGKITVKHTVRDIPA